MADGTIRINGKTYDADDLTLDEVEQIEEACGGSLEELDLRRAKVIKQVVFALMRRDNPELTLEQVGQIQVKTLGQQANGNRAARRAAAKS